MLPRPLPTRRVRFSCRLGRALWLGALWLSAPVGLGIPSPAAAAGLNEDNRDLDISPRVDFYRHANGAWLGRMAIPADHGRWGTFEELHQTVLGQLQAMAHEAAGANAPVGTLLQKVGDFYLSGMDHDTLEVAGAAPLAPALTLIDHVHDARSLAETVAELHKIGAVPLFYLGTGPDARDSRVIVAQMGQAGMGLPEPDDYLSAEQAPRRAAYVRHIEAMFVLLGIDAMLAQRQAQAVLRLETALAGAALRPAERRDPVATYHKMSVAQLGEAAPGFCWDAYFAQLSGGRIVAETPIVVEHPDFLRQAAAALGELDGDALRFYLTWHVLLASASYLSDAFVEAQFAFYDRLLLGIEVLQPRSERVLAALDAYLGEALGELYVKRHFSAATRDEVQALVESLRTSLSEAIGRLDWMSAATKQRAQQKLAQLRVKVGYPETTVDYTELSIGRGYLSNVWRAHAFAFERDLGRLHAAPDVTRWAMTPQTVNAYYNPSLNEIVFPAAILQPPFYHAGGDLAQNYGAIGGVIGHELTHGFDDQGRLYDGDGNLRDWWTPEDARAFAARAEAIVAQFSGYTLFDVPLDGALTQGENIADLGGAKIAYAALQSRLGAEKMHRVGGLQTLTPAQRFFFAWANVWRNNVREDTATHLLRVDPHAPGLWRTNGPLSNMPEFYRAFDVQQGDPMRRDAAVQVSIW